MFNFERPWFGTWLSVEESQNTRFDGFTNMLGDGEGIEEDNWCMSNQRYYEMSDRGHQGFWNFLIITNNLFEISALFLLQATSLDFMLKTLLAQMTRLRLSLLSSNALDLALLYQEMVLAVSVVMEGKLKIKSDNLCYIL